MDVRVWVAVVVGGMAGGLLRAALEDWRPAGDGWPWVTLCVNVAGAGLLGWVAVRLPERLPPSTYRRPLLGTGFCGGLTTFSTMQVEAVRLARGDRMGVAAAYVAVSLLAGLLVAALAMRVARRARWRA